MSDAVRRIEALALRPVPVAWAEDELALGRLERWLLASSNPATLLDGLENSGPLGGAVHQLLSLSGFMADVLAQNPEMGSSLLSPEWLAAPPTTAQLTEEGERLLIAATSTAHRWDRLRWLRQAWLLRIALADLGGFWEPEQIWRSLSNLADAILILARQSLWQGFALEKGLPPECPLEIVAFGKLGGQELNLWSDVDLLYVIPDDATPELEVHLLRFSTQLSRGLEEPMGRGSLYKVDLRLRPFGGRGAAASRWNAVESYYERYAEPWEHLALIRSRMIVGQHERWEKLRHRVCFESVRGTWEVETLLSQRAATENNARAEDLKRGPGGLRDIEFLIQILQLFLGRGHAELHTRATLEALTSAGELGLLSADDATFLAGAYSWLRQLEHRIQMRDLRQTQELPTEPLARAQLAAALSLTPDKFEAELIQIREGVRARYTALTPGAQTVNQDAVVALLAGPGETVRGLPGWLNRLENPAEVARALLDNATSMQRVKHLLDTAPLLMETVAGDMALVENLLSGEAEEHDETATRAVDAWVRWALHPDDNDSAAQVLQRDIRAVAEPLQLTVIGMGSLAMRTTRWNSDLDLVLVGNGFESAPQAHAFREKMTQLGHRVDFRLRPEGRNGPLVTSFEGLARYSGSAMEPWERLAFGRSRLITAGSPELDALIGQIAYGVSLSEEMLDGLLHLKRRMESERVNPRLAPRHLKLGPGGANDAEWLAGLAAWGLLIPPPRTATPVLEIFRLLQNTGFLDSVERSELHDSYAEITRWRRHLSLISDQGDVLPENPARLNALAEALGMSDGNAVLQQHQARSRSTRALCDALLDRVRSTMRR